MIYKPAANRQLKSPRSVSPMVMGVTERRRRVSQRAVSRVITGTHFCNTAPVTTEHFLQHCLLHDGRGRGGVHGQKTDPWGRTCMVTLWSWRGQRIREGHWGGRPKEAIDDDDDEEEEEVRLYRPILETSHVVSSCVFSSGHRFACSSHMVVYLHAWHYLMEDI